MKNRPSYSIIHKHACLLLFLASLISLDIVAQKESNWWYFGNGAGLHFNSDTASVDLSASYPLSLSSASLSNEEGDLIFYHGDSKLWNKDYDVMQNGGGLLWENQSERSTAIVPHLGDSNLFYVFTSDGNSSWLNGHGLFYHLVDISQDSGRGKIVGGMKNVVIQSQCEEKMGVTYSAELNCYWLMVRTPAEGKFVAYKIDTNGLDLNPIISEIGTVSTNYWSTQGAITFSHKGTLLVHQSAVLVPLEVYDFDLLTGVVSHLRNITISQSSGGIDAEFSPDDTKVYLNGTIQLDLTDTTESAIEASQVYLDGGISSLAAYSLQLAPDGKIYCQSGIGNNNKYMSIIHYPNQADTHCTLEKNAIYLGGRDGSYLPNFPSNYNANGFDGDTVCAMDTAVFIMYYATIDSVNWHFGDSISQGPNTSSQYLGKHVFEEEGTYMVTMIAKTGARIDTVERPVVVLPAPHANLGEDVLICPPYEDSVLLSGSSLEGTYIWSNGSVDSAIWVNQPGIYSLTFTNVCGSATDSIEVYTVDLLDVNLGPDTAICQGYGYSLDVTQANASGYLWQDSDTSSVYSISGPGTYSVTIAGPCDTVSDTVLVAYEDCPWPEGIEELLATDGIAVYPNPTSQTLNVVTKSQEHCTFELQNTVGATFRPIRLSATQLDVSNLPSGIYFLTASSKSFQRTVSVMIE